MYMEVVFAESSRKHGILNEDVLHVLENTIQVDYHDEGFTMFIGPDRAGNLLEVGTVEAESSVFVVIHAQQARPNKLR
jgi:hypothetical protein